jgi:hypothetical protein
MNAAVDELKSLGVVHLGIPATFEKIGASSARCRQAAGPAPRDTERGTGNHAAARRLIGEPLNCGGERAIRHRETSHSKPVRSPKQ